MSKISHSFYLEDELLEKLKIYAQENDRSLSWCASQGIKNLLGLSMVSVRTKQNLTESNRTKQNLTESNRTKQNLTESNRTKQKSKLSAILQKKSAIVKKWEYETDKEAMQREQRNGK